LIEKAYYFSLHAHQGQSRLSGEPFIIHPLEVASITAELRMDDSTITAALLHDVLEDTYATGEEIEREFGVEIASLVQGVTKLSVGFSVHRKEAAQLENYRRMFISIAEDVRVIIIKLADRLHNMRTLKFQYRDKKESIARETLDIFAPIARRLGIGRIQNELENLSLFFMDPEAFCAIQRGIEKIRNNREQQIGQAQNMLSTRLHKAGVHVEIQSRFKNIYSIYLKINRQKISLEDLHDLIALRVVTNTIEDCYAVLGIVHSLWVPVIERLKDYIAVPKSNMYQSLHTTVIGPAGNPMEIQIRTWDMHHVAEHGIAAHWRYKEGKSGESGDALTERMAWLRQILEWQQDLRNTREFMESLKISLFDDEVYVFTPKGDLKKLPKEATPIDFAYLIHTEVGNTCIGARVNKQIVPLDYRLKSGDIVEIITSRSSSGPSVDWLRIAQTPGARNKIRAFLRKKNRGLHLDKGRAAIERELEKYSLEPAEQETVNKNLQKYMDENHFKVPEDLFVAIGEGRLTPRQVVNKIIPYSIRKRFQKKKKVTAHRISKHPEDAVVIQGSSGLAVKLARCCLPVAGDRIVGFITMGKGITVHRADCANLARLSRQGSRLIEAGWEEHKDFTYQAGVVVEALDRPKLLADITNAVANRQLAIRSIHAHTTGSDARIYLTVEVRNRTELEDLQGEVKRISHVRTIRRSGVFVLK